MAIISSQEFSKYIVYVDESGDHGLLSIDSSYPVFVLAFCIFEKSTYAEVISPAIQKFKFKHFGHDMVVLHEQKIRKSIDDFKILINAECRQVFMSDLNLLMQEAPFTLIAVGINKLTLQEKYMVPSNPYHLALYIGLERIYDFLWGKDDRFKILHIIFESRGKKYEILEKKFYKKHGKIKGYGLKCFP
jgi:hypothetical protein